MSEPTENSEARQLCLHCMSPNDVAANFCAHCNAPLTSYAATGPMECLYAEGMACRFAAEQPRKLIVVLGVWLIFGPATLFSLERCAVGFSQNQPLLQTIVVAILGLAMAAISLAIIWKTTRNYIARNKMESPTVG
ncbi:MAG TPA: zinc ribbon domain-containing protein [Verrucomicrobiae bacterium]